MKNRLNLSIFSRSERLYQRVCPSVGWSVGPSVTSYLFGLLGATSAVYHLVSFLSYHEFLFSLFFSYLSILLPF